MSARCQNIFLPALLLTFTVSGPACDLETAPDAGSPGEIRDDEVQRHLEAMIQAKYDAMQTGDASGYAAYFASTMAPLEDPWLAEDDPARVAPAFVARRAIGSEIVDIDGAIEIVGIDRHEDEWRVRYVESFSQWYRLDGVLDPEPATGVNQHVVVLRWHDGDFTITALERDDGGTDGSLEAMVAPYTAATSRLMEGGSSLPLTGPESQPSAVCAYNATYATTYANKYCGKDLNINDARGYMCGNSQNYNGNYTNYGENDCANFVSQALVAGGRSTTSTNGDRKSESSWYYNGYFSSSYSWSVASYLHNNLWVYTPSTNPTQVSDIRVGDLVFMDFTSNSTIDHVMIVTEKLAGGSWSTVKMNGHTKDRYHLPLSKVVTDNPSASFRVIRPVFNCN